MSDAIIGAVIGGIVTILGYYISQRPTERHNAFTRLESIVDRHEKRILKLEKERDEALDEKSLVEEINEELEDENEKLKRKVSELEKRVSELETIVRGYEKGDHYGN